MTWTHTSRGKALDLLAPHPDAVDLNEIGLALSQQCRFAGNISRFYSVAEHSTLIAEHLYIEGCRPEIVLAGLLHDAAEAYTGDITWPIQQVLWAASPEAKSAYYDVQRGLDAVICARVGLDPAWLHADEVREADLRILLDERAELLCMPPPRPWAFESLTPLGVRIVGLSPELARQRWGAALEVYVLRCNLPAVTMWRRSRRDS